MSQPKPLKKVQKTSAITTKVTNAALVRNVKNSFVGVRIININRMLVIEISRNIKL